MPESKTAIERVEDKIDSLITKSHQTDIDVVELKGRMSNVEAWIQRITGALVAIMVGVVIYSFNYFLSHGGLK